MNRAARNGTCKKCRAVVLIGWSDDVLAFMSYVDPIPLGPVGEFLARANGRRTYALRLHGRGVRLYERDRWQIAGSPAGTRALWRFDVVADHACGQPLPTIPTTLTPPAPQGVDDEHPPF